MPREAPPQGELTVDLKGQTALVTGASRGLGKAIALAFGKSGANVACVARSADKLKETVDEIRAAGGSAEVFECDVTKGASVDQVVEQVVAKFGGLQILVNNAGITRDTLLARMEDDQWDEVINTNLRGAFLFTRAATRVMMSARYGRIINMASVSGAVMGNPGQANYSASKAALVGFTKTVAKEYGGRKITVNAIAPGFIESDMTKTLGDSILEEVQKRIPAKRLGKPEDVAAAALFLASPAASYITGQMLVVDGGMTC
jgi:3-oxoacyl-[acyl-carrier protein] reductase